MEPECKDIVKVILPAVRASVAISMRKRYGYTQERIARKLGVVQVAVSKYMRGRHSKEISKIRDYIERRGMDRKIVSSIARGDTRREIDKAIDELCDRLIAYNPA